MKIDCKKITSKNFDDFVKYSKYRRMTFKHSLMSRIRLVRDCWFFMPGTRWNKYIDLCVARFQSLSDHKIARMQFNTETACILPHTIGEGKYWEMIDSVTTQIEDEAPTIH